VFWVLPAIQPQIQQIIQEIAASYNDHVIPIRNVSSDHVHPTAQGYREIADQLK
jgi:lysophospholipase L1-like esterase